jgi:hypothetical protein
VLHTAPPANETLTTQVWDGYSEKLFTVCVSLIVSVAAAELVEVNRFLRTVVQGRAFWYYLIALLMVLGLLLSTTLKKKGAESQTESLIKLLPVGIVFGFLGSVIALSAIPLLRGSSLSPTISAWKEPLRLAFAAFLGLGWFYGALAGLTIYFIRRGRYWYIGILMLTCVVIRIVEMLPWRG